MDRTAIPDSGLPAALAAGALAAATRGRPYAVAVSPSALSDGALRALDAVPGFGPNVHVFLADTNFGAGGGDACERRRLVRALPAAQLHLDVADHADPVRAAAAYEQELRAFFGLAVGELPSFDAVVLRIAPCGNLASLASDSDALGETSRLVATNRAADGARFVTLAPPVIRNAGRVLVAACPDSAARRPGRGVPARLLGAPNATLLIDP